MPGTFAIDMQATFSAVLLMACTPKRKFGTTDQQETNAAGVPKWAAECAVTFSPQNGMQPVSEVISVSITAAHDPASGLNPGTPVALEGLRAGLNPPEKRDDGKVRGGRLWFTATGIRAATAGPARQPAKEAA